MKKTIGNAKPFLLPVANGPSVTANLSTPSSAVSPIPLPPISPILSSVPATLPVQSNQRTVVTPPGRMVVPGTTGAWSLSDYSEILDRLTATCEAFHAEYVAAGSLLPMTHRSTLLLVQIQQTLNTAAQQYLLRNGMSAVVSQRSNFMKNISLAAFTRNISIYSRELGLPSSIQLVDWTIPGLAKSMADSLIALHQGPGIRAGLRQAFSQTLVALQDPRSLLITEPGRQIQTVCDQWLRVRLVYGVQFSTQTGGRKSQAMILGQNQALTSARQQYLCAKIATVANRTSAAMGVIQLGSDLYQAEGATQRKIVVADHIIDWLEVATAPVIGLMVFGAATGGLPLLLTTMAGYYWLRENKVAENSKTLYRNYVLSEQLPQPAETAPSTAVPVLGESSLHNAILEPFQISMQNWFDDMIERDIRSYCYQPAFASLDAAALLHEDRTPMTAAQNDTPINQYAYDLAIWGAFTGRSPFFLDVEKAVIGVKLQADRGNSFLLDPLFLPVNRLPGAGLVTTQNFHNFDLKTNPLFASANRTAEWEHALSESYKDFGYAPPGLLSQRIQEILDAIPPSSVSVTVPSELTEPSSHRLFPSFDFNRGSVSIGLQYEKDVKTNTQNGTVTVGCFLGGGGLAGTAIKVGGSIAFDTTVSGLLSAALGAASVGALAGVVKGAWALSNYCNPCHKAQEYLSQFYQTLQGSQTPDQLRQLQTDCGKKMLAIENKWFLNHNDKKIYKQLLGIRFDGWRKADHFEAAFEIVKSYHRSTMKIVSDQSDPLSYLDNENNLRLDLIAQLCSKPLQEHYPIILVYVDPDRVVTVESMWPLIKTSFYMPFLIKHGDKYKLFGHSDLCWKITELDPAVCQGLSFLKRDIFKEKQPINSPSIPDRVYTEISAKRAHVDHEVRGLWRAAEQFEKQGHSERLAFSLAADILPAFLEKNDTLALQKICKLANNYDFCFTQRNLDPLPFLKQDLIQYLSAIDASKLTPEQVSQDFLPLLRKLIPDSSLRHRIELFSGLQQGEWECVLHCIVSNLAQFPVDLRSQCIQMIPATEVTAQVRQQLLDLCRQLHTESTTIESQNLLFTKILQIKRTEKDYSEAKKEYLENYRTKVPSFDLQIEYMQILLDQRREIDLFLSQQKSDGSHDDNESLKNIEKDIADSIQVAENILEEYPKTANDTIILLHQTVGMCYQSLRKLDAAVTHYKNMLTFDPKNLSALYLCEEINTIRLFDEYYALYSQAQSMLKDTLLKDRSDGLQGEKLLSEFSESEVLTHFLNNSQELKNRLRDLIARYEKEKGDETIVRMLEQSIEAIEKCKQELDFVFEQNGVTAEELKTIKDSFANGNSGNEKLSYFKKKIFFSQKQLCHRNYQQSDAILAELLQEFSELNRGLTIEELQLLGELAGSYYNNNQLQDRKADLKTIQSLQCILSKNNIDDHVDTQRKIRENIGFLYFQSDYIDSPEAIKHFKDASLHDLDNSLWDTFQAFAALKTYDWSSASTHLDQAKQKTNKCQDEQQNKAQLEFRRSGIALYAFQRFTVSCFFVELPLFFLPNGIDHLLRKKWIGKKTADVLHASVQFVAMPSVYQELLLSCWPSDERSALKEYLKKMQKGFSEKSDLTGIEKSIQGWLPKLQIFIGVYNLCRPHFGESKKEDMLKIVLDISQRTCSLPGIMRSIHSSYQMSNISEKTFYTSFHVLHLLVSISTLASQIERLYRLKAGEATLLWDNRPFVLLVSFHSTQFARVVLPWSLLIYSQQVAIKMLCSKVATSLNLSRFFSRSPKLLKYAKFAGEVAGVIGVGILIYDGVHTYWDERFSRLMQNAELLFSQKNYDGALRKFQEAEYYKIDTVLIGYRKVLVMCEKITTEGERNNCIDHAEIIKICSQQLLVDTEYFALKEVVYYYIAHSYVATSQLEMAEKVLLSILDRVECAAKVQLFLADIAIRKNPDFNGCLNSLMHLNAALKSYQDYSKTPVTHAPNPELTAKIEESVRETSAQIGAFLRELNENIGRQFFELLTCYFERLNELPIYKKFNQDVNFFKSVDQEEHEAYQLLQDQLQLAKVQLKEALQDCKKRWFSTTLDQMKTKLHSLQVEVITNYIEAGYNNAQLILNYQFEQLQDEIDLKMGKNKAVDVEGSASVNGKNNTAAPQNSSNEHPPQAPFTAESTVPSSVKRSSMQLGWNCFDIAIDLEGSLKVEEPDPRQRALIARSKLVELALQHTDELAFRNLLAVEIKSAVFLTGTMLLNPGCFFDQNELLPVGMHTEELKNIFSEWSKATLLYEDVVRGCKKKLQSQLFKHFAIDSLDNNFNLEQFFMAPRWQKEFPHVYRGLSAARSQKIQAEQVLDAYCIRSDIYSCYLRYYYGTETGRGGWFTIQPDGSGSSSTSMVDMVAHLLKIQITIYDMYGSILHKTAAPIPEGARTVHVRFDHQSKHFQACIPVQSSANREKPGLFSSSTEQKSGADGVRNAAPSF